MSFSIDRGHAYQHVVLLQVDSASYICAYLPYVLEEEEYTSLSLVLYKRTYEIDPRWLPYILHVRFPRGFTYSSAQCFLSQKLCN